MIDIQIAKYLTSGTGTMDLHFELSIQPGQAVALYGPSGSGKSSIIRMIAGLMRPDSGTIKASGDVWFDHTKSINKRPQQRDIGVVFQDPALFPHMTVRDNIAYSQYEGTAGDAIEEILQLMELTNLADKMPRLLSGGQKQRVALARAIVRRPALLLLDEPTSAMDTALRLRMQEYILSAQQKLKMTVILVTHDVLEILRLANYAMVIENGRILSKGKPADILPVKELKDMISKL